MKNLKYLFLVILIGGILATAACGKKGDPFYEEGFYPRGYPSE